MSEWNLPPKPKIYEALTAVAEGRVRFSGAARAQVVSSTGEKTYTVSWSDDMRRFSSDDNASRWQGYLGYPIIAVLIVLGKLEYRPETARKLAGVPWKEINTRFRRDYGKAVESVLEGIAANGGDAEEIIREVDSIYEQLSKLRLERLGHRKSP